jgi:hypothetical protein
MTKSKNENGKEKKAKQGPHPFGPPEARAKSFNFPSPNPTLLANDKSTASLPENLQEVVAAIAKHSGGVSLRSLKVAKLSPKTLAWLVRSLCKHGFLNAQAEEKPEPKKAVAKKEEK